MKPKDNPTPADRQRRIATLVESLQDAERELQELTRGERDAVETDGEGYFFPSDAQEKLRTHAAALQQAAEMQSGILNALPAHIALLDEKGVIIAVNESWRRFGSANVLQSKDFFVGQNYLSVCDRAHGDCSDEAAASAKGIRQVLCGEVPEFSLEYPCHSLTEKRWFRMMVTPVSHDGRRGAVVMHVNATPRRMAEEAIRVQEAAQRRIAEELTLETLRLHESQAVANVGSWETDAATLDVTWTAETYRIFETTSEQFQPTHEGFLEFVHPDDRQKVADAFTSSLGRPGPISMEHRLLLPRDKIKHVEERWQAFHDAAGKPVRVVGTCQDITQRKAAEELIAMRTRQQEVIAAIGFEATRATTLEDIFDVATRAVAQALGAELCKVLQLAPDGGHLRLVSGVGWQPGLIGVGTVGVELESQAGFTLKADGPIYVNDFARETRFKSPMLLQQHDVVSGLSVKILLREKPWGVLGAHCRTVRTFNDGDADFMKAVAMLLAMVIERLAVQHKLTESEARMRDAQRIAQLGNWELDISKNELTWSDEVFRIFGQDPANFTVTSKALVAVVHPDDRETMQAAQQSALFHQGPLEVEYRIIRGDGVARVVRERGELIRDENGLPVALSGTVLDITDLRSAQGRAERMNALLTEAQRIADMGSWEMDLVTGRLLWPEETCRLFGIKPEKFGGTFEEFSGFILPEDRPGYSAVHTKTTPAAPLLEAEYRIRRPDGTVRWMFERGLVTFDSAGKVTRRLGVVMDITERRKNEEQLRLLETCVSRLNDIVLITEAEPIDNPGPRILYVNDAFVRRTGFTREESIGQTPRLLQGPKTQRDALDRIRASLKAWKPCREELINYTKAGEEFWIELDIVPVADANGWFTHWVAIERDITERKRADAQLREQADLLNHAQDAILVRDLDNKILYWNKSAERLYGWNAAEAIGRLKSDLLHTDEAAVEAAQRELLAKGEWTGELVHERKDGESITVEARWTLMRDTEGKPRSVLAINTDVTHRKRLEAQFLRAQRMESIGTLAGGIAHDLNNVLSPIMMSIGLLQMTTSDKQSLEVLETIAASAKRGAEMVSQVLSFARGMEGRRIEVQVRHIMDDVAKIARDTFSKSIRIETRLDPNLWILAADPTQLHQVLLNLCVNARDAMTHGGKISLAAKNVMIDAHYAAMNIEAKVGPYVKIDVEDSGTGIPQEIIGKIFDPFFTTKEIGKGTGLGLSTSLAIVKSHGGFIQVYSEPGNGTRFSINLPAHAVAGGPAEVVQETEFLRGRGEIVLVIDDEAAVREITKQTLEAFGYRVLLASDGAEGLVQFVSHRSEIAVVLTDMMMPVMDGPATIHALLRIDPNLRIIAASGITANGNVAKAANAGIKDFLPKPYTAETLLRALAKALHGKK